MSDAVALIASMAPSLAVFAIVMGAVAHHIAAGALAPNGWVGIRTRATRRSREAWDAAHHAALPWLRRSAAAAGTAAVLLLACLLGGDASWVMPAAISIAVAGYVISVSLLIWGSVLAQRAANRV